MKLTAESTVFNDQKVTDKFAELIVDADGIRTEVGKKVGNDEVISRINQSAESVKIQADKVEVDGTLIVGKSAVDTAKAEAIGTASKTASDYITSIDSGDGIRVHAANNADSNYTQIDTDGMNVYKGGVSVAEYGDIARIGKESGASRIELDYHSLQLKDREGDAYFYVSDLRNQDGYIVETFIGDGTTTDFPIKIMPSLSKSDRIVTINGVVTTDYSYVSVGTVDTIRFTTAPQNGAAIEIKYIPLTSGRAKAFTFGGRKEGSGVGGASIAMGTNVTASGTFSYAEGHSTISSGYKAHAEGEETTASGGSAHAEGYHTTASANDSHAEGSHTKASNTCAHAEGYHTTASGSFSHSEGVDSSATAYGSHASGISTIATGRGATAIGIGNKEDTSTTTTHPSGESKYKKYAFQIGNGTEVTGSVNRSDALEVEWNGNTKISGTLTQSSDRRLKEHISYLDNDAVDFIRKLKPAYFKKDDQNHVGFYAQDVEEADKWDCMVGEMNGYKTLGYTELIAPLVAYCQHLEKRIEALEREQSNEH